MAKPRPSFAQAWGKFQEIDGDGTLAFVGNKIGGKVKQNFDLGENGGFTNGCATRMSYVFNYTGFPIHPGVWATVSGGDNKLYIYRVAEIRKFITSTFGPPDMTFKPPYSQELFKQRGLLVFDVRIWSDASGHVTLWNGTACSDHCYFPQASVVYLWKLK